MRIAIVGTRGVPARYGGFETCVEEVGARLVVRGHEVVVYCRGLSDDRLAEHRGMRLVHLPAIRMRSTETLSHSALSVAHLVRHGADAVLLFNAANAPLLPVLRARGLRVATHVDGLEWQRAKWAGAGRQYYRRAESMAVRWSDLLIADAQGISDYYEREFGAPTTLITYGAPVLGQETGRLSELGLTAGGYHLVVARMEPENHVDVVVEGYVRSAARLPLVLVGSAPYAGEYTARVHTLADNRVRLLGSLWDQALLDQLYTGALSYLHGHSVGGTNPSLLRALGAGTATDAFDVSFNREVLGDTGRYWRTADDVRALVEATEQSPEGALARGGRTQARAAAYDWDDVATGYEDLCARLAAGDVPSRRPHGYRSTPAEPIIREVVPVTGTARPAAGAPAHPPVTRRHRSGVDGVLPVVPASTDPAAHVVR